MEEAHSWTKHIPDARIKVVNTKSQAVAMVRADECAAMARDFFFDQIQAKAGPSGKAA
jgi:hypothetical protein